MNNKEIRFEKVAEKDAGTLYSLIIEMATYEKDLDEVKTSEEKIKNTICNQSCAEAFLGYCDGTAVCYMIYFYTYSSYLGKQSVYIEDIYIKPEYRKFGIGKKILSLAAKIAVEKNCERLDWTCLDWNKNAIEFYKHMGANHLENRYYFRAEGDELVKIANACMEG